LWAAKVEVYCVAMLMYTQGAREEILRRVGAELDDLSVVLLFMFVLANGEREAEERQEKQDARETTYQRPVFRHRTEGHIRRRSPY
jgi:hypothetical protein